VHASQRFIGALGLSLLLSACGGGGGDGGSGNSGVGAGSGTGTGTTSPAVADAQVIGYVKSSNIDFVPGANGRPAGTWRWPGQVPRIAVHVPTPTVGNATETDYANKVNTAIGLINARLSGLVVLEAISLRPVSGNYIQISYGTSWVPPGSTDYAAYCANVATGPNEGSMIMPDAQNGIASRPVYINLGNGRCDVTQDIVTHEFGHALGLANHFASFGDGPATPAAFLDVLATLYGNPVSTPASTLVVVRARN